MGEETVILLDGPLSEKKAQLTQNVIEP
jgi:hypothetical protein